jgi:hypothetical protein
VGYFVREAYRLAHCIVLFEKLHAEYARGGVIHGYIMSLNHAEHCAGQNLRAGWDARFRKGVVRFAHIMWLNCGRAGGTWFGPGEVGAVDCLLVVLWVGRRGG